MIKLGIKTKIKFLGNKLLKSVFIDLYKIKENDNQDLVLCLLLINFRKIQYFTNEYNIEIKRAMQKTIDEVKKNRYNRYNSDIFLENIALIFDGELDIL